MIYCLQLTCRLLGRLLLVITAPPIDALKKAYFETDLCTSEDCKQILTTIRPPFSNKIAQSVALAPHLFLHSF
jgi:hypothetical protein